MVLQSEMNSMQSRARDMMVCQGAEVSSAAVSLANLSMRLQTLIGKLVQDYSITDSDIEVSYIYILFFNICINTLLSSVNALLKKKRKILSLTASERHCSCIVFIPPVN